jgi:triosephosphate isomerase (TIM)
MIDGLVPLVAGNWKMNGLRADLGEIRTIVQAAGAGQGAGAEILVCPPATLLMAAAEICKGTSVRLGGQNCDQDKNGPHTGDLSAEMLADAGAAYVILGHSERRAGHGETSEEVRAKAQAALRAGLVPIICVGETLEERQAGHAVAAVGAQLKGSVPADPAAGRLVIAYEPVWAIGSGSTPAPKDVAEMHAYIRHDLSSHLAGCAGIRILYGGSVKPENAAEWRALDHVNGVLVGGASLESASFMRIVAAFR